MEVSAKFIQPYTVTAANILATNLADEPLYSAGANYAQGDIVRVDQSIYEYRGTNGTTHASPTETGQTDWVFLGPMNKLRPFDLQKGVDQESVILTQAENADSITYTINGLSRISAVAFENVEAQTIRLVVTDATLGEIYDITYQMRDLANYVNSWWDYLNLALVPEQAYRNTALNIPPSATIEVTVSNPGGTAKVGASLMGYEQGLGSTMLRPSWSLNSYSFRQFDGFKRTLVRLNPGEAISADVKLPLGAGYGVRQALKSVDGIASLWEFSQTNEGYTVFGVLESAVITAETAQHEFLNIKIEGL